MEQGYHISHLLVARINMLFISLFFYLVTDSEVSSFEVKYIIFLEKSRLTIRKLCFSSGRFLQEPNLDGTLVRLSSPPFKCNHWTLDPITWN